MTSQTEADSACGCGSNKKGCTVNRRQFLFASGAATFTVMVTMNAGSAGAKQVPALVTSYPRKLVAKLSQLEQDKPVSFEYPDEGDYAASMIVKLGEEAGGGVGPDKDIVSFNLTCTHQGGSLEDTYVASDKALGPCPLHLSTYDLTRHGILISGQAYQSLPQVLLEIDGDDVFAVGMFGLIYGRQDNLKA